MISAAEPFPCISPSSAENLLAGSVATNDEENKESWAERPEKERAIKFHDDEGIDDEGHERPVSFTSRQNKTPPFWAFHTGAPSRVCTGMTHQFVNHVLLWYMVKLVN